jgi:hypothetical protein
MVTPDADRARRNRYKSESTILRRRIESRVVRSPREENVGTKILPRNTTSAAPPLGSNVSRTSENANPTAIRLEAVAAEAGAAARRPHHGVLEPLTPSSGKTGE